MKKNVIVLIALLSIGIASYAQQVESLGSVPAWVKEKTTPEEYQVWKFLSEYYQIDYSGLKSRDFQGQRKEVRYAQLRAFCDAVRSGEIKPKKGSTFIFSYEMANPVAAYASADMKCMEKKYIIYSSMEGYDAHVELTVIYANTRGTTGIRLLGSSVKGKSFSKLDVDVKETVYEGEYKKYGFQIKYDPNAREFVGYYPGTLSFKDAKGADYVENVSVNFRCSVND